MCLAIPGKIVEKNGSKVTVDYDGEKRHAEVVEGDRGDSQFVIGDYVIIQGGVVIDKVPPAQVKKWKKFLKEGA